MTRENRIQEKDTKEKNPFSMKKIAHALQKKEDTR